MNLCQQPSNRHVTCNHPTSLWKKESYVLSFMCMPLTLPLSSSMWYMLKLGCTSTLSHRVKYVLALLWNHRSDCHHESMSGPSTPQCSRIFTYVASPSHQHPHHTAFFFLSHADELRRINTSNESTAKRCKKGAASNRGPQANVLKTGQSQRCDRRATENTSAREDSQKVDSARRGRRNSTP